MRFIRQCSERITNEIDRATATSSAASTAATDSAALASSSTTTVAAILAESRGASRITADIWDGDAAAQHRDVRVGAPRSDRISVHGRGVC